MLIIILKHFSADNRNRALFVPDSVAVVNFYAVAVIRSITIYMCIINLKIDAQEKQSVVMIL